MLKQQKDVPAGATGKDSEEPWMVQRHTLTLATDVAVKKAQERVAERQREMHLQRAGQAGFPAKRLGSASFSQGDTSRRAAWSNSKTSKSADGRPQPMPFSEGVTPKQMRRQRSAAGKVGSVLDAVEKLERLSSVHTAVSVYRPRGDGPASALKRPATASRTPTQTKLPILVPGSADATAGRSMDSASSPIVAQPPKGSFSARDKRNRPRSGRSVYISEHLPRTPSSARTPSNHVAV